MNPDADPPRCAACRCTLTPESRPVIGFLFDWCDDCSVFAFETDLTPGRVVEFVTLCWATRSVDDDGD